MVDPSMIRGSVGRKSTLTKLMDTEDKQPFDKFNKWYHLYLKVYYKCQAGQTIAITGSIPGLGDWTTFTELVKTQGDMWVTREPILSNIHFYRYKYVIYDTVEKKLI